MIASWGYAAVAGKALSAPFRFMRREPTYSPDERMVKSDVTYCVVVDLALVSATP